MKLLATNKKARWNYYLLATYECGIALVGSEIKALRNHHVNLGDGFAVFKNGELFLINVNIPTYQHSTSFKVDPLRSRKLLLHRKQLIRIALEVKTQKLVIVPTKFYFKHNVVKVELGVGRPKKLHDKRQTIKDREQARQIKHQY